MKLPRLIIPLALTTLITSCSPSHHRQQADKEVYQILKKAESAVFGKPREFTIDTRYSNKKPSQITAPYLFEQSQQGGEMTLTIDQALTYAAEHSLEYQNEKEDLYLTALTLTNVKNNFSPILGSNAGVDLANLPNGDALISGDVNNTLSQSLLAGGSYSLALANDLLRFFTGAPRSSATSAISLNILQPLLRGAGRKIAAEQFTQANRNVIYAVRDFQQFQNSFAQDIVIDYLRLLQQKETVENQFKNYISRKESTEYLRARSVDRASPEEVSDSEQSELQAKNSWINAKSSFQTSLDNYKITLGIPTSTALYLEDNELQKIIDAGLQPLPLDYDQALNVALQSRLPLINEIDQFDDTKRDVVIAANQLKADLDFIASASLNSADTNPARFNFDDLSTQVGIELNLPINRINERNNYRSALIQFESDIRSLSRTYDNLNNLISLRIRQVNQFKQNYEIQRNAVKLAENRVEGNQLRLQAGTVIFRRLSESQDALIDAQNAVTDALIDYLEARLQLYTDIGTINPHAKSFWLKKDPSTK